MLRIATLLLTPLILSASSITAAEVLGDPIRGGRMWDRWWVESNTATPTGTHPLYPATGNHAGPDSFRCNECHGWDYQGAQGAYANGDHFTGIKGVLGHRRTPDELFTLIQSSEGPQAHGYGALGMSDRDVRDMVAFLTTELIDVQEAVDSSGAIQGDPAAGKRYFTHGSGASMQCVVCHGPDGQWRNFGTRDHPKWIGTLAKDNPPKLIHKIRFGQPGSIMPSWIQHGGTETQVFDLGAYAQQLPSSLKAGRPNTDYAVEPARASSSAASSHTTQVSAAIPTGAPEPPDRHPLIAHTAIHDLDQDGRNDIVACDVNLGQVVWMQQQPDGSFIEHAIGDPIAAPVHAAPSDLDQDGDLDLLIASMGIMLPSNADLGSVVVLENDGHNRFTNRTLLENVRRVTDVRSGDLDGDGDLDLAVSQFGYVQGEVQWLENLGDWQFESHHLMDRSGAIHGPITDIDSDGDLDIVVLFSQEWETVQAFVNDGHGQFTAIVLHDVADADYSSSGLSVGDIAQDGDVDIAWTNGDAFVSVGYRPLPTHGVQWLENNGNLDFTFHRIGNFHGAYDPTIIDLDRDGDQDILTASEFAYWDEPGTPSLRWWSQNPDGTFTPGDLAVAPIQLVTTDAGDLDGDGLPDIVAGGMALSQPFDRTDRVVRWKNLGIKAGDHADTQATAPPKVQAAIAAATTAGDRGMIQHAHGLFAQADTSYETAEHEDAQNPKWPYYRGMLDLAQGDSDAAFRHLQRAADLDHTYPVLHGRLGELHAARGDISAAEASFARAGSLPLAVLGTAQIAFGDGDWERVIALLQDARIPAGLPLLRAAEAHRSGSPVQDAAAVDMGLQYEDAWMDAMRTKAVTASPLVVQAEIAFIRGDLTTARTLLDRAVEMDPTDADARLAIARALLLPKRATPESIAAARSHLKVGLQLAPDDVAMRSQHAWALYLLNRHDEAAAEWLTVLEDEPRYAPSLLNLGQLHAQAGRHQQALEFFRRGMAIPRDSAFSGSFEGPYRAAWLMKQAASAKALGGLQEAVESLRQAIELTPNDPEAHFQLGNAMLGLKRFDAAVDALTKADALRPGTPRQLAALGYALMQLRRPDEAIPHLQSAVSIAPNYALAWFHLGNALRSTGDRAAAAACYERAIEIRPDFDLARQALERL